MHTIDISNTFYGLPTSSCQRSLRTTPTIFVPAVHFPHTRKKNCGPGPLHIFFCFYCHISSRFVALYCVNLLCVSLFLLHAAASKGVPDRPRLRLVSTDSTSAKLELKVRANSKQPPLWCSIFHRPKFGQPKETLLPARNLNSIHITPLRCGTSYRSVFALYY